VARRPLILAGVAVAAVIAVVVVVLIARGGSGTPSGPAVADPLAEALSYAPASSEVVVDVDVQPGSQQRQALSDLATTFPAARFAAEEVRGAVRNLGFDADADLPSLLGGPLVIAGSNQAATAVTHSIRSFQLNVAPLLQAGATGAVVGRSADDVADTMKRAVDDGRLRELPDVAGARQYTLPNGAGVVGVRDADLVLAGDTARLRAALAVHDRHAGLTRAAFENRLGPLKGPALIRATANPRSIIGNRAPGVPWVDALRGGSLALRIESPGLRLRAHLATDPTNLKPSDLPLAPGPQPPSPAPGSAQLDSGVRGLSQTIHVLDASRGKLDLPLLAPVLNALTTLDKFKGPLKTFGRIDVDAALIDQLTGTTTITKEPHGMAIRAELRDGGPLRTALNRIAAIPDFIINLAHVTDLNIAKAGDDAYEIRRSGTTLLRVGVFGTILVATTDLNADLRAIAARRPSPAPLPGALSLHADGRAIQDLIVTQLHLPGLARLVLGGFGNLDAGVRAELTGLDLDAALQLNR